jgi:hypothetical protein
MPRAFPWENMKQEHENKREDKDNKYRNRSRSGGKDGSLADQVLLTTPSFDP